ncbi:L14B protein, partial [Lathyrus oleraceus]
MPSRAYVSQFSADGSLFVAGFQGNIIKIYNVDKGWKVQKNILTKSLRWTITDTSLSPDQRSLVYASMSPIVHIVNVGSSETESLANVTEIHDGLDFSSNDDGGYSFGIFSVKFSTDGRELVAGTSGDSIHVYDLEANKVSLQILAHAVCDRRCLNAKGKPAGVLMGHLEGITFIDTRGDGRYFISNGKDQTIKLW